MLKEQLTYIRGKFKSISNMRLYPLLINDLNKIIIPFYRNHPEYPPTEAECRQCLNMLEAENAEDYTLVVVYQSYREANTDVPELERDYPRIRVYLNRVNQLKTLDIPQEQEDYDKELGD